MNTSNIQKHAEECPNRKKTRRAQLWFFSFVGIFLFTLILHYVDFEELVNIIKNISIPWALAAFFSLIFYQIIRAIRFKILVGYKSLRLWPMFNVMCIHGFFNMNLPAGIGEVALAYMLKSFLGVSLLKGSASIFFARILDGILFSVLFFVLSIFYIKEAPPLFLIIMGFFFCFLVITLAVLFFLSKFKPEKGTVINGLRTRIMEKLSKFASSTLERRNAQDNLIIFITTALMWISMLCMFYFTIIALGFYMPVLKFIFFYLLIFPFKLLPIKGIADLGTHESSWIIALSILDVHFDNAALSALGSHLLFFYYLTFSLVFPVIFLLARKLIKHN